MTLVEAVAADPEAAAVISEHFRTSSVPAGSRPWLRRAYAAALAEPGAADLAWWRLRLREGTVAEYGDVPWLHEYDLACTCRVVISPDLVRLATMDEPVLRALAAEVTAALDQWAADAVEELLADAPALATLSANDLALLDGDGE